jgi:hypothetical protein
MEAGGVPNPVLALSHQCCCLQEHLLAYPIIPFTGDHKFEFLLSGYRRCLDYGRAYTRHVRLVGIGDTIEAAGVPNPVLALSHQCCLQEHLGIFHYPIYWTTSLNSCFLATEDVWVLLEFTPDTYE